MASPLLGLCGRAASRAGPRARLAPQPSLCSASLLRSLPRRPLTTAATPPRSSSSSSWTTLVGVAASLAVCSSAYLYATDTRAWLHSFWLPAAIRTVFPDAEDAHHFGTESLRVLYAAGLHPRERAGAPSTHLPVAVFGHTLANPIGISAGLDKHAEIPDALFAAGAAVVEVGGCTPRPQDGSPRPRVFRVPHLDGLVNRYGLNSIGADAMAARLRDRVRRYARDNAVDGGEQAVLDGDALVPPGSLVPGRLLLVQIAKQKETAEGDAAAVAADYVYCTRRLAPYADVIVVNVSSPNTPGLRDLQATGPLTKLLGAVVAEAARTNRRAPPKVMVKVSPDEDSAEQVEGIVQAVVSSGVDGVIVGNTTKRRDGLVPAVGGADGPATLNAANRRALAEQGGFSGPALFDRTVALVEKYRRILDRQVLHAGDGATQPKVVFASGGITDGDRALRVLEAGASVAMVYTGLVYNGLGLVTRMKMDMRARLDKGR